MLGDFMCLTVSNKGCFYTPNLFHFDKGWNMNRTIVFIVRQRFGDYDRVTIDTEADHSKFIL